MNLFRHKLVILIVLSWVTGIAAVVCFYIPGMFWSPIICMLVFVFCRASIPGPNKKWPVDKKSLKEVEADGSERVMRGKVKLSWLESLVDVVMYFSIFLGLSNSGVLSGIFELVHAQRQNPLLIIGLVACGLRFIVKDIRYFSNVPERDLEPFYVD